MTATLEQTAATDRVFAGKAYIDAHYREAPTLAEIAKAACLSMYHFHRVFAREFGVTPLEYTTALQVEECKRLMLDGVPLGEIAGRVGFCHQSHFTQRFKQVVGQTPSRWRRNNAVPARGQVAGGTPRQLYSGVSAEVSTPARQRPGEPK